MPREAFPTGRTPPGSTPNPDPNAIERASADLEVRVPIIRPGVRDSALSVESIPNRTWEEVRPADLGPTLLNAIRQGLVNPAHISTLWQTEPWRMLEVFGPVLQQGTPMHQQLLQWKQIAQTNPAFLPNFLATNIALVDRMRVLNEGLALYISTQQASRQQLEGLMSRQSSNWIDGVWRDYRRTINFQRDPALSTGLVIGGVMVGLWLLRGKSRAAGWARFAAGFTVLAVFLRQRYGIQISEDLIARPLETWGAPQMANAVRVFRDTLRAPFVGDSQRGSAVALAEYNLGINGDKERLVLAGIMRMSPAKFLIAYNAAKRASVAQAGQTQLPEEVREMIREFQRNHRLADNFSGLSDNEKLAVFLRVSDKFLASLSDGRDPARGLAFLEGNFVRNPYQRLIARAGATRRRDGTIATAEASVSDIEALQTASDAAATSDINMLDVFLATRPDEFWNGPNSLQGFESVEARRARDLRNALIAAARDVRDTAVTAGRRVGEFVLTDVPRFFTDDVWPRVSAAAEAAWPTIRDVGQWLDDTQYSFRKNTPVGQFLESLVGTTVNIAGDVITVSGREIRKLSVWVAWKRMEGTGVNFADFRAFENGSTAAGTEGITAGLRAGRTSFSVTNPVEARIWRSLHDLGIASINNRDALGAPTSTPAFPVEVQMSPEQARKLRLWIETWHLLFGLGDSASDAGGAGVGGGTPVRPGVVPAGPPLSVPELNTLDARVREIEAVDIGRGVRGLFVERLLDGRFRIGFRTGPADPGEYFTAPMTHADLVGARLVDLVQRWRNGVPNRLKQRLLDAGRGNPALIVTGAGNWNTRFEPGDMIRYVPVGPNIGRFGGVTTAPPVATSHLTDLVTRTPAEIIGRYKRLVDTTALASGDPITLP